MSFRVFVVAALLSFCSFSAFAGENDEQPTPQEKECNDDWTPAASPASVLVPSAVPNNMFPGEQGYRDPRDEEQQNPPPFEWFR